MFLLRQCGALIARRIIMQQRTLSLYSLAVAKVPNDQLLRNQPVASSSIISIREHKNFGHATVGTPRITKLFHLMVFSFIMGSLIDWRKVKRMIMPKVDAEQKPQFPADPTVHGMAGGSFPPEFQNLNHGIYTGDNEEDDDSSEDAPAKNDDNELKRQEKKMKEKIGFRERKIIEYENRIRNYSTPDKVFRYFATVRLTTPTTTEVCMTPDDFIRSLYPGAKQPDGLGLDQYRRYDPKSVCDHLQLNLEKNSIFYKLGSYGLITFSDYIFLLTVLSTSRRHFEIAFQMFDLNGDGDVDCDEFEKVATLIRQQTSIGNRHRDHANTGNTFKGVNSALTTYFFGPELNQKLTIEKFLKFQYQLQREILTLEFKRKNPDSNGLITEVDFAELLLAYAGYSEKKKQRKLKRVKRHFRERNLGVSKTDYLDFFHFLNNINDVDTALTFYHIAGASIDRVTLKHVAKTVAMVDLSDHVIDIVFTIFDENNDNQLSNREFVGVMKSRLQRGLEKSKDTGFIKLMHSMLKCAKENKPVLLDL